MREAWADKRAIVLTGVSVAAVVGLLALHYSAALHPLGLHDVLRRLFYLPVITAAIAGGMRGGLLTAGIAAVGYLPHLRQLERAGDRPLDHALELLLLPVVGMLVGGFADSSRRARALAAERGRLAALGEVGVAVMAQAEGPLAAIEGQVETLDLLALCARDPAAGFAARVIRAEVLRTRHLLEDLRGLSHPGHERLADVRLSAMVAGLVREIAACPSGAGRITLGECEPATSLRADRDVLAHALRSLLLALLKVVPVPGGLHVRVQRDRGDTVIEIRARAATSALPDIEESLGTVFGAGFGEYHFSEALCVHLLSTQGATATFDRISPQQAVVRLAFRPGGHPDESPPSAHRSLRRQRRELIEREPS